MKKFISFLLSLTILITMVSIPGAYASEEKAPTYDNQEIIKEVALAYHRQGTQILYDQLMSRRHLFATPEEATAQRTQYLDCSSYVNSCYRVAFGENILPFDFSEKSANTANFAAYAKENPDNKDVIGYWENANYTTPEQRQEILSFVRSQLQVGDILCYRRGKTSGTAGHVYIYMGDDTFMHCMGGGSYTVNRENPQHSYDGDAGEHVVPYIDTVSSDALFTDTTHKRYLFVVSGSSTIQSFCLLRPLARGLTPTEATLSRMKIAGLVMEKVSSVFENSAVHTGDTITYTITLENTTSSQLSDIKITDVLPGGTAFVSGSKGITVDGQSLKWSGSVDANSTVEVAYDVTVTETAPGALIESKETYVNGIKLGNITHSVSGYSQKQELALRKNALEYASEGKPFAGSIDMISSIYKTALGVDVLQGVTEKDILDQTIDTENYTHHTATELSKMIAPNLYGGYSINTGWARKPEENDRTRLVSKEELMIGDIIVADYKSGSIAYLYTGDSTFITVEDGICKRIKTGNSIYSTDADNMLITLSSYDRFAVLRPSMISTSAVDIKETAPTITNVGVMINGKAKQFDVMPVIENDRTLVPMRAIFEELGASVLWDADTRTVTAAKDDTIVMLQIDNPTSWINGVSKSLDTPAKIISGRTMVPVRFVAEALKCKVNWDDFSQTVIIANGQKSQIEKGDFNGKKVLFLGNQLIARGRIINEVSKSKPKLEDRIDQVGGLWQLCKANGEDVSITSWAITNNHTIEDLIGNKECSICGGGVIHSEYLTDRNYDYVFVSPSAGEKQSKTLLSDIELVQNTFKAANPDVKIILLGNSGAYGDITSAYAPTSIVAYYDTLRAMGIPVIDAGAPIKDILTNGLDIPGSKAKYSQNTFITKDGLSPNLLGGYIQTLMVYCTITGKSAVGQPYEYIMDMSLAPTFDIPGYVVGFYANGYAATNFPEILQSQNEMKCLQMKVDEYLLNN